MNKSTRDDIMDLIKHGINRFITEAPLCWYKEDIIKLAQKMGCEDQNDPVFQEALMQLQKDEVIHFIGAEDCYFFPTEKYVISICSDPETKEIDDYGKIQREEVRKLKKKFNL